MSFRTQILLFSLVNQYEVTLLFSNTFLLLLVLYIQVLYFRGYNFNPPKYFYELFIANQAFSHKTSGIDNINIGRHLISILTVRDNTNTAQLV